MMLNHWLKLQQKLNELKEKFASPLTNLSEEQREQGVTLIEMLAVVVILGIVSAIAVPAVETAINSAKVNSTESDLGTVQQALERYYFDHNQYPATLAVLSQTTDINGAASTIVGAYGPYVNFTFPENDAFGNPIYYAPASTSGSPSVDIGYVLASTDGATATTPAVTPTTTNYIWAAGGTVGASVSNATPTLGVFSANILGATTLNFKSN